MNLDAVLGVGVDLIIDRPACPPTFIFEITSFTTCLLLVRFHVCKYNTTVVNSRGLSDCMCILSNANSLHPHVNICI